MKILHNMINALNRGIIWQNFKWIDPGDPTLWFVEISNKTNWVFNSDSYFIAISWNVTIKRRVFKQSYLLAIAFLRHLRSKSKGKQRNDFNVPSTIKILLQLFLVFLYFYDSINQSELAQIDFSFLFKFYSQWNLAQPHTICVFCFLFFSYRGFLSRPFTNHRTAEERGEGDGGWGSISLTPHSHFHSVHKHLDTSRAITAENPTLHIGSSRTWTGKHWFPSASR